MKTYIWTIPTRIFHWLLVLGFTISFVLGEIDELSNFHFAFGAYTGILLLFRFIFGFIGPKYSNFKDFPIGIKPLKVFLKTYFSKINSQPGHNPAASIVMLLIVLTGIGCALSGFLLHLIESNLLDIGIKEGLIEKAHKLSAKFMLLLSFIHLLGITGDTIFHSKTKTLRSIFTGFKETKAEPAILNSSQKIFIYIWFIAPILAFYLALNL